MGSQHYHLQQKLSGCLHDQGSYIAQASGKCGSADVSTRKMRRKNADSVKCLNNYIAAENCATQCEEN